nr:MAG TPA: hypothetical protein [Caudoviricetes sp.]
MNAITICEHRKSINFSRHRQILSILFWCCLNFSYFRSITNKHFHTWQIGCGGL